MLIYYKLQSIVSIVIILYPVFPVYTQKLHVESMNFFLIMAVSDEAGG